MLNQSFSYKSEIINESEIYVGDELKIQLDVDNKTVTFQVNDVV